MLWINLVYAPFTLWSNTLVKRCLDILIPHMLNLFITARLPCRPHSLKCLAAHMEADHLFRDNRQPINWSLKWNLPLQLTHWLQPFDLLSLKTLIIVHFRYVLVVYSQYSKLWIRCATDLMFKLPDPWALEVIICNIYTLKCVKTARPLFNILLSCAVLISQMFRTPD